MPGVAVRDTASPSDKQHHRRSAATTWGGKGVDHDTFLRLQQEYVVLKKQERADRAKMVELGAHLARVEEAAKRCMVRADPSAKGGAAARLLAAETQLARLAAALSAAEGKLAQERRAGGEQRQRAEALKARLQAVLRDQRRLVVQVGHAEATTLGRRLYGSATPPAEALPEGDGGSGADEEDAQEGLHEQLGAALARVGALTQHLGDSRDALSTLRCAHTAALQELREKDAEIAALRAGRDGDGA